ncbi:3-deoxy-D-manno-octulosonic-acid transferase [Hypnocyclicus thermotrophus]|uniref:3-deoxy-D-manno-octulosonic acid transferase n=1 Tax=Hypnocyclicus thermotrophus TaxID=1627895 RepID=A0AA46DXV8_9FUSO|nr:glycosyltransferase N-terminal domain-containing protein [Hypnocyclicus thermotrophus]TDT69158.1 3-deoxy-D-manno-octulosonic-acid transferase [Hypnocyclicus thermotrophus]
MIYNIFLMIIYAIGMLFKRHRIFFLKRFNFNLKEDKEYIWLHCASVGETNLIKPFINKILNETNENILLTVITETGYENAKKKYTDTRIKLEYFPLDNPFVLNKIFKQMKIKKVFLIETEIWKNFINIAYKNNVKIYLINGRISDKSYKIYLKFKFILKKIFDKIDLFCMQSNIDRERIIKLGAKKEKVVNTGNLKFSIELEQYDKKELNEIKEMYKIENKKVFVAGSTRDGEEEILLNIFDKLENTILFIVPRHLERVEKIKELIKNRNYSLYSKKENKNVDIVIIDKIGVLRKFYALSDISFVGGTLVNIGGHSLLEPLGYNKTPIFGKYLQNVKYISEKILNYNIGYKVESEKDFLESIKKIEMQDKKDVAKKIKDFFNENTEALNKVFNLTIK